MRRLEPRATEREPIAVVGMACRFPGAGSVEDFWQLMADGRDAVSEVPSDRWNVDEFYDPLLKDTGKTYTRRGAFIRDVEGFDAGFFGISRGEAENLDPQQRQLLEVTWEALEHAAIAADRVSGTPTGVFIGIGSRDHGALRFGDLHRTNAYTLPGNAMGMVSNRISNFFNLQGPSLTVDTACSGSLVALHLACQSLQLRESSLALAGGVHLTLTPNPGVVMSQAWILSAEGRCKAFDAEADGYVRGEGCGVVVLKRLSDALQDHDNILAIIRASAVNQDGRGHGLTMPNAGAQQSVITEALRIAGLPPHDIGFIEAHGIGSLLTDAAEIRALAGSMIDSSQRATPCVIGSVKTNIGHLEAASGVASLIKAVLALKQRKIPPNLHLETLNPETAAQSSHFLFPSNLIEWPSSADGKPRRAGVNSFGIGGTNAHVILEEFTHQEETGECGHPVHLLALSAVSEDALRALAARYLSYIDANPATSVGALCFTSSVGRSHFSCRLAIVATTTQELCDALRGAASGAVWSCAAGRGSSWQAAANRYVRGEQLDWSALYEGHHHRRIHLPSYPFQHQQYPIRRLESIRPPNLAHVAPQVPAVEIRAKVREEVAAVLGCNPAAVDDAMGFAQMGMTSLMAVDLRNRLQIRLGLHQGIPATIAFDCPTVEALTRFLSDTPQEQSSAPARETEAIHSKERESIAIIGMGCRIPGGATDSETFWQLLRDGVDAIEDIPAERWDVGAYYDADPDTPDRMYTRSGGFIKDVDRFDAAFFGISPREAASMDPQQRILLEVAWEALENAGEAPNGLARRRTGVFIGTGHDDYWDLLTQAGLAADAYRATGNLPCAIAGRVSFALGLQGPTLAVDTACSSSLVAIHLAVQSLRSHECDTALAGGVGLMLAPEPTIMICRTRALSQDGRCRTFDAGASGYVRSEGCGVVVLKRLSAALRDNDRILAVIRGSAVNHDGPSSGFTVPNGNAQQAVLQQALLDAKVEPSQVGYIEAHGTGTALGDPIEMRALTEVFGGSQPRQVPLVVASVKTNIGHLESAAGVAGVMKTVLALQHETIPAHLHLKQVNPHISFNGVAVTIPRTPLPWTSHNGPRFAGVSAFGLSGTNAHVILEEAPAQNPAANSTDRPVHLLSLSAKTDTALTALTVRYRDYLAEHATDSLNLADICFTANCGRSHFNHRLAIPAESVHDLREKLNTVVSGKLPEGVRQGRAVPNEKPRVVFLFTGQGSQYAGMGRQLYETAPVFRRAIDRCAEVLDPLLGKGLASVLYPKGGAASPIHQTAFTQPVLFAFEYALAELWRSWGIEPAAVMGHSLGEYVAACVAGVFSLEDGLKLVVERARLMQSLPESGEMAAVFATASEVGSGVSIAAVNGPDTIVISGDRGAIAASVAQLEVRGLRSQRLQVSHAFHSALMDPILDSFERLFDGLRLSPPRIPVVSNLTGEFAVSEQLTSPQYWRRHLRETVQFSMGVRTLLRDGYEVFVEIGPAATLLNMARSSGLEDAHAALPSLRKGKVDCAQMLESLAALHVRGVAVDWHGFDREYSRRKVSLPTYPFERQRHWFENRSARTKTIAGRPRHFLLGEKLRSALKAVQFEAEWSLRNLPFLRDHRVYGSVVVPAAAYLASTLAASEQEFRGYEIDELVLSRALFLSEEESRTVQIVITPSGAGNAAIEFFSLDDAESTHDVKGPSWIGHASGSLKKQAHRESSSKVAFEWTEEGVVPPSAITAYYDRAAASGIEFGPQFRQIERVWLKPGEVVGQMRPLAEGFREFALWRHIGLMDSCLQLCGFLFDADTSAAWVPVRLAGVRILAQPAGELWCRVRTVSANSSDKFAAELCLFDGEGTVVAEIDELQLKQVSREKLLQSAAFKASDWMYEVQWKPTVPDVPGSADVFPRHSQIAAAILPRIPDISSMAALDAFDQLLPQMDVLIAGYVEEALEQLGADSTKRETLEGLAVLPKHRHLLDHLLQMLSPDAVAADARVRVDLRKRAAALRARYPEFEAELSLLDNCGRNLANVLRGETDPLQLLFPGGSFVALEKVYQESPFARAMNTVLADAVGEMSRGIPKGRALRILEIGAGTGSTTSYVLPQLTGLDLEYVFTDVSSLFTLKAEKRFQQVPGMSYRLLDIEKDPIDQGFAEGRFDLVIASNVLHATRDLAEALRHVRRLLATGGALVLLEVTGTLRWLDLVFGLTDGWWRFADIDVRPSHPLLPQRRWRDVLQTAGFDDIVTLPESNEGRHLKQHSVILARKSLAKPASDQGDLRPWLIVADRGAVATELAQLLEDDGKPAVLLDSQQLKADAAQILAQDFRAIVHLPGIDCAVEANPSSNALEWAEKATCADVLRLTQEISRSRAVHPPRLCLVTRGAQPVGELAPVALGAASLWGLSKVIGLELPELHCLRVDLDPAQPQSSARVLLNELRRHDSEDQVAYRSGARYVARLAPSKPVAGAGSAVAFRSDGTYLITGGMGGLGLLVARWMIERGAQHIVLVGRTRGSADARRTVNGLRELGAEIQVLQADVSSLLDVQGVLAFIREGMPGLRGIVHSVGVLDDGVLLQQTWERFERVLRPKVRGAWNLHTATEGIPLDCFILFSSTASVLGSPGQGNHAAANAFLDAFAHHRRALGLPCQSINWGAWSEIGAAAERRADQRAAKFGMKAIGPAEGLIVLEKLFQTNAVQTGVFSIDWNTFVRELGMTGKPAFFQDVMAADLPNSATPEQDQALRRKLFEAPVHRRRQILLDHVCAQSRGLLGFPSSHALDVRASLIEMGMDSLMATDLRSHLQAALGQAIPATLVFDYPTIEGIVGYLSDALFPGAMAAAAGAVAPEPERFRGQPSDIGEVAQLSEEEVLKSIAAELAALRGSGDVE
jgi:acyl transferase domain-containing protein/acyl carrier protein